MAIDCVILSAMDFFLLVYACVNERERERLYALNCAQNSSAQWDFVWMYACLTCLALYDLQYTHTQRSKMVYMYFFSTPLSCVWPMLNIVHHAYSLSNTFHHYICSCLIYCFVWLLFRFVAVLPTFTSLNIINDTITYRIWKEMKKERKVYAKWAEFLYNCNWILQLCLIYLQ